MLHDEAELIVERTNAAVVAHAVGFRTAYISAKVENGKEIMDEYVAHLTGE